MNSVKDSQYRSQAITKSWHPQVTEKPSGHRLQRNKLLQKGFTTSFCCRFVFFSWSVRNSTCNTVLVPCENWQNDVHGAQRTPFDKSQIQRTATLILTRKKKKIHWFLKFHLISGMKPVWNVISLYFRVMDRLMGRLIQFIFLLLEIWCLYCYMDGSVEIFLCFPFFQRRRKWLTFPSDGHVYVLRC